MAGIPQIGSLLAQFGSSDIAFNTTKYFALGPAPSTTESGVKVKWRSSGTMSKFQMTVTVNTIATSATTFRTRINGVNGNQSISVAAGTTGSFQDTTNTDSITSGDDFNMSVVTPNTSGSMTLSLSNLLFAASSNSFIKIMSRNGSQASSSLTSYANISGGAFWLATEASTQTKFKTAGTLQNMFSNVTTNSKAEATTLRVRKNGANGNQVLSITALTTGQFEDTSNTDTVAVDDLINVSLVEGISGLNISWGVATSLDFVTTDSTSVFIESNVSSTIGANLTRYFGLAGEGDGQVSETGKKALALVTGTLSKLNCYVSANTVTAASTLKLRKNTANGNQSVSITASTTGFFEDASNTDSITPTDVIDLQLVTGATGTSLDLQSSAILITVPTATVVVVNIPTLLLMGTG